MAGLNSYIHTSGAVPVQENSIPASTFEDVKVRGTGAIPANVAGLVIISAGVLLLLNILRFNFVIGLGSN